MIDETLFAWVIEHGDSSAATPKYWAAGQREAERSSAWTGNNEQAIRFARKIDAERVASRIMKGVVVRIAEHGWTTTPPEAGAVTRGNYEGRHPTDEIMMPLSDVNNLDEVCRELGIQDSDTTPAEAVRELKAEIERLRAPASGAVTEREALADSLEAFTKKNKKSEWEKYHPAFTEHEINLIVAALRTTAKGDESVSGAVRHLVNEQANDAACWLLNPTIAEAYLQGQLRKLHAAIEAAAKGDDGGMREAITDIYFAAHWIPDRECDDVALWTKLRDAAGIVPGQTTEKLGPKRCVGATMRDISTAPKKGEPFLALVNNWYRRKEAWQLLRFSINGYWETAYTGDQTFEKEDIIGWWPLSLPAAAPEERE